MRRRKNTVGLLIWLALAAGAAAVLAAVAAGLPAGPSGGDAVLRYFSADFLEEAARYERARLALFLARQGVVLTFLAMAAAWSLKRFGGLPAVPVPRAAGYALLYLLLLAAVTLPLDFYRGFMVEHRFALSTQPAAGWFADYIKGLLVSLAVSTAGLTGVYWLALRWQKTWWVLAGAVFALFLVAASYLYPVLIDPLFHRFTPLADSALEKEILDLAGRAGISVEGLLVADASRRTVKANAYFSGLGGTRRIVLYDNLIRNFPPGEVLAVVAHEMGHWRRAHIARGIAMGALGSFLALYLFHLAWPAAGKAFNWHLVPLAVLFFSLASLAAAPLENALSRIHEREADQDALVLTGNPEAFISLKQRLAQANLSVVQPHPLIRAALYTHPPVMERIRAAEKMQERSRP